MHTSKSSWGGYPLIFADGSIKNISMSKVHVSAEGVSSIPENCYPIIATMNLEVDANGNWASCSIGYGAKRVLSDIYIKENWVGGAAANKCAYIPITCSDYNDLINGKFKVNANRPSRITNLKYFVWAEK